MQIKFMRMEKSILERLYRSWKGPRVMLGQNSQFVLVRQGESHFQVIY